MATTFRTPQTLHPPLGAYAHQAEVTGANRTLIMSGQVGRTLGGEVPEDPIAQVEVALENVRRNLAAAGMAVGNLTKLIWYLVGDIDPARRRQVTRDWLGEHEPCATLVYVVGLAAPEYRVEIDGWACMPA